ncbi:hypothetical protein Snoj_13420 [Streptomyces nojiriensis]|uniref:Uncharacterized protein n=1 Tax=Streptomyces nojiriensis TaxID=66374 RepID=A0ABQ3SH08_9ACTN|nr:hypothetical protein [Streptomyces nojiriensis]QTI49057.1 hypothetical protein JYK04_06926 [Streptomyces nojiriensis]GGS09107.1 hypothetical protein GCM10010205_43240 [Streptomyces nojiriensis]GHI67424.1 hypothetical protein Snoj_13420 [Streptomyces nojiriensis]
MIRPAPAGPVPGRGGAVSGAVSGVVSGAVSGAFGERAVMGLLAEGRALR